MIQFMLISLEISFECSCIVFVCYLLKKLPISVVSFFVQVYIIRNYKKKTYTLLIINKLFINKIDYYTHHFIFQTNNQKNNLPILQQC